MFRKTLMQWLVIAAGVQRFYKERNLFKDMTQLKIKLVYLKFIKTSRFLFLSLLGVGVCLTLLLSGIVLFHLTLFFYAPWNPETKLWVGLGCAAAYLLAAAAAFSYVFQEEKWLKIFNAEGLIEGIITPEEEAEALRGGNHHHRHN